MADHMEDEEKIGSDEDLAHAKEDSEPEKPSDKDLLKAYLEEKEEEEKEKWAEKKS